MPRRWCRLFPAQELKIDFKWMSGRILGCHRILINRNLDGDVDKALNAETHHSQAADRMRFCGRFSSPFRTPIACLVSSGVQCKCVHTQGHGRREASLSTRDTRDQNNGEAWLAITFCVQVQVYGRMHGLWSIPEFPFQ